MVNEYWKDPETGIEAHFRKDGDWGWCVSFPKDGVKALRKLSGRLPWPKLAKEEQEKVDENYEQLGKLLEEDL